VILPKLMVSKIPWGLDKALVLRVAISIT
jgi:hypothetical protein